MLDKKEDGKVYSLCEYAGFLNYQNVCVEVEMSLNNPDDFSREEIRGNIAKLSEQMKDYIFRNQFGGELSAYIDKNNVSPDTRKIDPDISFECHTNRENENAFKVFASFDFICDYETGESEDLEGNPYNYCEIEDCVDEEGIEEKYHNIISDFEKETGMSFTVTINVNSDKLGQETEQRILEHINSIIKEDTYYSNEKQWKEDLER